MLLYTFFRVTQPIQGDHMIALDPVTWSNPNSYNFLAYRLHKYTDLIINPSSVPYANRTKTSYILAVIGTRTSARTLTATEIRMFPMKLPWP